MSTFPSALQALRALWRRRRGGAVLTALLLGSGIALATVSFAFLRALLLMPLPYADDARLHWIWSVRPDVERAFFSVADVHDYREQSTVSAAIAGLTPLEANLRRHGIAERVSGLRVTGNFFATLGVQAQFGRLLDDQDERENRSNAVIDWPLFEREFGANPERLGDSLDLDGVRYQVVGVLPRSFVFPGAETRPSFAVPLSLDLEPRRDNRGANFIRLIVRSQPGRSSAELSQEFARMAAAQAQAYPETNAMKLAPAVIPLREEMAGETGRLLQLMLIAIAVLLSVVALNLGALTLLAAHRRGGEWAVREALGAGRWRAVTPLLGELLWLGSAGLAVAAMCAPLMLTVLARLIGSRAPRIEQAALGVPEFGFALAVGTLLLLAIATPSALAVLRGGTRSTVQLGARWHSANTAFERWVLAAQLALSLAIVVGLATAISSWQTLARSDLGFNPQRVASVRISLPPAQFADAAAVNDFIERARAALSEAGIESAMASALPLSQINSRVDFSLPGFDAGARGFTPTSQVRWVSANYFDFMRLAIEHGQGFNDGDHARAEPVAVIDGALQARYWPDANSLGDIVTVHSQPPTRVIGLSATVPHFALAEQSNGTIYLPIHQLAPRYTAFVASRFFLLGRSAAPAEQTLARMQAVLSEFAPLHPPSLPRSVQDYVDASQQGLSLLSRLLSLQALATALLCALGAYALSAASSHARRREIGIRLALGSTPTRLQRALLRSTLRSLLVGGTAGSGLAILAYFAVEHTLGISADLDVRLAAGLIGGLFALILFAAWMPSKRAAGEMPAKILATDR